MTVRELIEALGNFDEGMEVKIGMAQDYGSNFVMDICNSIDELTVNDWDNGEYKAVIITEGSQIGTTDCEEDD